ncbi:MAG: hypothetical protein KF774_20290 [Planctomyces sp.]|nr:hypothetical protein [Planctomyces sp.]
MIHRVLSTIVLAASCGAAAAEAPRVASVEVVIGARFEDEGGPADAPASPLNAPFGLDFDAQGGMYIVELEGGRVRERTPEGVLRVMAGDGSTGSAGDGGPAVQATFNGMHNVAVTKTGQLLISDTWNHCVRAIDLSSRTIDTLAGTRQAGFSGDGGPARDAQFDFVMCVALTHDQQRLLIADINNFRVRDVDLRTGIVRTIAGNGRRGAPEDGQSAVDQPLVDPRAAAADSQGRVYVLERGGHALRRIDLDGTIRTVAGDGTAGLSDGDRQTSRLNAPKHLCVDDSDRVWIADDENAAIRCYDPRSEALTTVLGRGTGDATLRLRHPHGVCWRDGVLWVADTRNDRILKVTFAAD